MKRKDKKGKKKIIYRLMREIRKFYNFFVPPNIYIDLGKNTK